MFDYYEGGAADTAIWTIISLVLAVVGGIVLYFTFLRKSNDGKFKKFWGWRYDFLNFKKLFLENLLRVLYLITTIFVTLFSFAVIGKSFLSFLGILVIGNLITRIIYEFLLILLVICRNTSEMNSKLGKNFAEKLEENKSNNSNE